MNQRLAPVFDIFHTQGNEQRDRFAVLLAIFVVNLLIAFFMGKYRLRLNALRSLLLAPVFAAASILLPVVQMARMGRQGMSSGFPGVPPEYSSRDLFFSNAWHLCAGALAILLGLIFITMLLRAWTGKTTPDAARPAAKEDFQYWLRPGNIVWVALIAFFAWQGMEFPFGSYMFLGLALLAAAPTMRALTAPMPSDSAAMAASAQAAAAPPEDLTDERNRVLKMLEDGKITAEESAELLNALAHSARREPVALPRAAALPMGMLAGAALVLAAFFMPWFQIDLSKMVGDAQAKLPSFFNEAMGGAMQSQMQAVMQQQQSLMGSVVVNIKGPDVRYGLGWLVLLLAIASPALLYFKDGADDAVACRRALYVLLAGSLVGAGLLLNYLAFLTYGFGALVFGYGLLWAALLRHRARILGLPAMGAGGARGISVKTGFEVKL